MNPPLIVLATALEDAAAAIARSAARVPGLLRLRTVKHGREAIEVLRTHEAALAVTVLPVRFSYDLLTHLLGQHRALPRLTCSPDAKVPQAERLSRAGKFADLLQAPLGLSQVKAALCESLGLRPAPGVDMSSISLTNYVELVGLDGITCAIRVHQPEGGAEADLHFSEGELVAARMGDETGPGVLARALEWPEPLYSVFEGCSILSKGDGLSNGNGQARISEAPPPLEASPIPAAVQAPPAPRVRSLREQLAEEIIDYSPARVVQPAVAPPPAAPEVKYQPPKPAPPPPGTFQDLLEDGMDSFRRGDYSQAVNLWSLARQIDASNNLLAYNLRLAEKKLAGAKS